MERHIFKIITPILIIIIMFQGIMEVAKTSQMVFVAIFSIIGGGTLGLIIGSIIDWIRKPRSVRVHLDKYSLSQVNMNNRPNPSISISDEITKLDQMRQNNIITEEEFIQFKGKLIGEFNQNNYRR